jgi:hypothetical protein
MSMEQNELEGLIIDYIDNKLNTVDKQVIEQELMRNADAYKVYEQFKEVMQGMDRAESFVPPENLKIRFDALLQQEIANQQKTKTVWLTPAFYRVAAAVALLVVGGGAGYWISQQHNRNEEIVLLEKQIELTRQLVFEKLNDDQSASQRMLGVKAAYESVTTSRPDDEIIEALVTTLDHDSNSNVRLAALDALARFTHEKRVRTALVKSLATQIDPVVQIALIQLLVQMKETEAMKSLQQIIDDEQSLPAVKDEAHVGMFKLS